MNAEACWHVKLLYSGCCCQLPRRLSNLPGFSACISRFQPSGSLFCDTFNCLQSRWARRYCTNGSASSQYLLQPAPYRYSLQSCVIVGFCHGWTEFFRLLSYYVAWGGLKSTFRDSICTIVKGQEVQEEEDWMWWRNWRKRGVVLRSLRRRTKESDEESLAFLFQSSLFRISGRHAE